MGLVGWHSVTFRCSDRAENKVMRPFKHTIKATRWTRHTNTLWLWHLTRSAGTCDGSEPKNSWQDGGDAHFHSPGDSCICYSELGRRVGHHATHDHKYCSRGNIRTFALIWLLLKAFLLLVQTVHEHSNDQIWKETPFKDVQVLFDCISPSSFTHRSTGGSCKVVGLFSLKYRLKNQFENIS